MKAWFDVKAFYAALDKKKKEKGLSWRAVAKDCGVHISALSRMAQGGKPSVDNLAALLIWLDRPMRSFIWQMQTKQISAESRLRKGQHEPEN